MPSTGHFSVSCSGNLEVDIHRPGLLGMFRRPIIADCLQFSLTGIQIESDVEFKVGEKLVIDLKLHDLRVEELPGVVRSVSVSDGQHYYEIEYDHDRRDRPNTLHCLRHIDTHIRHQLKQAV
ncbi:MAG: hypothetical protein E2O54_12855 [Gammaproteobacteria bacterium]|nr:MAG: hypothetical protein E2O58_05535 [Gammaproteobacteria bacterium]TDJ38577.1 MAG: hypothetical protein E2O54_12855 [Gammaproteobacteria bacterium]